MYTYTLHTARRLVVFHQESPSAELEVAGANIGTKKERVSDTIQCERLVTILVGGVLTDKMCFTHVGYLECICAPMTKVDGA